MHRQGQREKTSRMEGVNYRRKRILRNTPKARAAKQADEGNGGLWKRRSAW
jgi:hypothetical protein